MLPFRRILFPVDYSNSCGSVAGHVSEITRRFSADLVLLHAFQQPLPLLAEAGYAADMAHEADIKKLEQERLRKFADDTFPGVDATCLVEIGDAGGAIAEAVRRHAVDLVMM